MTFKNILLALIPCIIAGCKKQDILIYDSEIAGIYFQNLEQHEQKINSDSATFSFTHGPVSTKDTILGVQVMALGKLRDYPRTFKVSADPASTAVEGIHFEIDHSSAVFPAGAEKAYIHVKVNRTDDMSDSIFRIVLKLEDNEHFKVYMEKMKVSKSTLKDMAASRFTLIVDDVISEPNSWRYLRGEFFGNWSKKKNIYINSHTGWTQKDWTLGWVGGQAPPSSAIQRSVLPAATASIRDALQALANAGTPMLEEDGSPMQLSNAYKVIY
jgi:hypothetical protein